MSWLGWFVYFRKDVGSLLGGPGLTEKKEGSDNDSKDEES